MSEGSEARGTAAPALIQVPVDLVEFEARLVALERRLREQEARDELLLGVAQSLRRLTDVLGPLLAPVGSGNGAVPAGVRAARAPGPAPPPDTVSPERLALAQARVREAAASEMAPPPPPPGRRSWLLRALRRMVAHDPDSAGRLVLALLAAHDLAGIEPVARLPGPPATVARVIVKGRFRRRLGWEMAELDCGLRTVSALAKLVRLRASPGQLRAAGVVLDPGLALALAAVLDDRPEGKLVQQQFLSASA